MTAVGIPPADLGALDSRRLYLYAILEESSLGSAAWRDAAAEIEGLTPVRVAGLVAAAGSVPAPFAQLAESLGDDEASGSSAGPPEVAGVEAAVRAHESGVERLLACGPVLPVRLGTVIRSADDVARLLERDAADLRRQLDSVGRRREWGLKVWWLQSAALGAAAPGRPEGEDAAAGPGRAYLSARRRQREETASLRRVCEARAESLCGALEALAPASCRVGLLAFREGSHAGEGSCLVLDGSFLVDPDDEGTFFMKVEQVLGEAAGLSAECSGPWPPYAFTRVSLEAS